MRKSISIIGGGASGLALAAFLDESLYEVKIYERNTAFGRKFLVAGKGGFNLSHSKEMNSFKAAYTPNDFLVDALDNFTNTDFRSWLEDIGIPTYIGSSKKIFPSPEIKPIAVLKAIEKLLENKGVKFLYNHEWIAWNESTGLLFKNQTFVQSDYIVFALGGASWKVTGSDGNWQDLFKNMNILTNPFQASNVKYITSWPKEYLDKHEGSALKNLRIKCGTRWQSGELVITKSGIEGNAIYGLSSEIRKQLIEEGRAVVYMDMKRDLELPVLQLKIESSNQKNITEILKRKVKLTTAQIDLLKISISKSDYLDVERLSYHIKNFKIEILETGEIDEAISTVGGVSLDAVNEFYELYQHSNHFCIGEMLDWDAPTGGYLLQACFSMGAYLAHHLNERS